MEYKFYTYVQNNARGKFYVNRQKGIGMYVIIEAVSSASANEKAKEIGLYFNGVYKGIDCPCCGDRWHEAEETEANEEPLLYKQDVEKILKEDRQWLLLAVMCVIHYANGSRKVY